MANTRIDTKLAFDAKAIIEHLGGVAETVRFFTDHGVPVQYKTVHKWGTRGFIPDAAVIAFLAMHIRNFKAKDFVKSHGE